jgi:hypothetical protein
MTTTVLPRRTLPDVLYHYTTRAWAQEISMAGQISLGSSGKIYLTDVLFKLGWQATDYLALPERNAELVIPILTEPLEARYIQYLGLVPEIPARNGRSLRRGGGHEWVYTQPIPVSVVPWTWIGLEVP